MRGDRLDENPGQVAARPGNVGILALDVYVPFLAVSQEELEKHDGVEGKYTVGLGQSTLRMCGDQEDTVSMALSVVSSLLAKYGLEPGEIGRVDVGTESDLDAAKPIKSFLMELLGAGDVEGADYRAACYAATAALLSAVDWVTSEAWDGRFALVVATDVSIYTDPGARATGGAGAVAMLVGPNAPLVLERRSVSSHCCHAYDWYKPAGPVPQVDGKLSVSTYLGSLEMCFERLCQKLVIQKGSADGPFDFVVLHHPYNKLVQKAAARLCGLIEKNLSHPTGNGDVSGEPICKRAKLCTSSFYETKVHPSTLLGRECGNMYTGSVYASLASLIHAKGGNLAGNGILVYSYGSGAMSSVFILKGSSETQPRFALGSIKDKLDLSRSLKQCKVISPAELEDVIAQQMERHGKAGWMPSGAPLKDSEMPEGAYFLESVDNRHRRHYRQAPAPPAAAAEEKAATAASHVDGSTD